MEQITYPEITLLVVEESKSILGSRSYMFDPDVITSTLFKHQDPTTLLYTSVDHDLVLIAEEIKPRSEWNITQEQAQEARDRLRQKRLKGREERKKQWGR